jgi:hypothetical protein
MSNEKLRRQIACEAARMLSSGQESQHHVARLKAARRIVKGWIKQNDLPSLQEIRDQIRSHARTHDSNSPVPPAGEASFDAWPADSGYHPDRFEVYRALLAPLETVRQSPESHPEGDALYHSLQVFALARDALPYDEEFQLAALLHDVGKAIDPRDHVNAALESLNGHITPRTAWLIEHHSEAGALRDGTLGIRARRRLEASEDFDDLMLLCDCDRRGRQCGAQVPDVHDALASLRDLAQDDA